MELELWQATIALVGVVLGPTGAVWLTARAALNGMRADVRETKTDVAGLRTTQAAHGERLASIEAKLEVRR